VLLGAGGRQSGGAAHAAGGRAGHWALHEVSARGCNHFFRTN
jgi:hypothetical protein